MNILPGQKYYLKKIMFLHCRLHRLHRLHCRLHRLHCRLHRLHRLHCRLQHCKAESTESYAITHHGISRVAIKQIKNIS